MAKDSAARYKDIPLQIVGSTKFGRYPKISVEETYNQIISDDALVPFAGYSMVQPISPNGTGRGIYSSTILNSLFAVIDNKVIKFDTNLGYQQVGTLNTYSGDVFIAENNGGIIAFTDGQFIYTYNYSGSVPVFSVVPFVNNPSTGQPGLPGYLTFQNGYLIVPDASSNFWYLSSLNGATWVNSTQTQGAVQTKPTKAVACVRFPGRGNLLMVFGQTVAEQWYNVVSQLFPYQRSQSTNVDYGCINPASIAEQDNIMAFVAINEKAGPTIMYTTGGDINKISTDGIDFKLATLTQPANVYGFFFRQDGHLLYVVTWPHDNVSYCYDFNTHKIFTLCDENTNAFIAKKVAFFNDQYYFVSINDGNLYQLGTQFTSYNYGTSDHAIPRIRVTPPIRMPDQSRFICGYTGFTIEQGQFDFDPRDTQFRIGTENYNVIGTENGISLSGGNNFRNNVPRVDMAISKNGAQSYSNFVSRSMRPPGVRQNRLMWWKMGAANDLTHQFRFYGFQRFVAFDGVAGIYQ